MKFVVSSSQFGFVGKIKERENIELALEKILNVVDSLGCIEDDEDNFLDILEITYGYDMDVYTVQELRDIWKKLK